MYPPELLARRDALARKPAAVTLEGARVTLRPLDLARDVEPLHAISSGPDADEKIWRYMSAGPFADAAALGAYLAAIDATPDARPFTVVDTATGQPLGVACYLANHPEHLKIELGSIWYGFAAQGTGANRAATLLMLEHAFGLGYQRLEWKCDAQNERSRRAALGMGFRFEGVQDAHMIVKGCRRDTAWFRILADEWPAVRARLRALAAPTAATR